MVKITGTRSYIKVQMDGKVVKIPGEMIVGGFIAYKDAITEWEEPYGEPIGVEIREELIKRVVSKTKDSNFVIVFE
ncbi:Imm74 family immunity protein [Paenibacillus puldeungensis]|uniref:Imm74 family immunity protein n=1 Tax=Paenibacillus puldeungensis TaxID=696536 RepID=A0ABW3S3I7_9BACL